MWGGYPQEPQTGEVALSGHLSDFRQNWTKQSEGMTDQKYRKGFCSINLKDVETEENLEK
jgi:hypothetical protein